LEEEKEEKFGRRRRRREVWQKKIVLFHQNSSYVYMGLNRTEIKTIMERYLLQITIRNNRNKANHREPQHIKSFHVQHSTSS
jgi:hypothetical protein